MLGELSQDENPLPRAKSKRFSTTLSDGDKRLVPSHDPQKMATPRPATNSKKKATPPPTNRLTQLQS